MRCWNGRYGTMPLSWTNRVHPAVFFIKNKDGALQLVQDYRALNAMTMKNRYPIPLISELINQL